ncbi:DUF2378 family protein [Sandaracinus amylolyticus]|uniref:DUF2378 family protein n=1 Tax=Sandaracinus amylolyticus TaxID=927083 RepID=A0A0F6W520_9BACT|nr:DUF2378 family protein [Sandaracinus amylolyticus]AKF07675.1 hypothetical protein DB32_004824 [Sandaracinus amylolyticus]
MARSAFPSDPSGFADPPWNAPLDAQAAIRAIPESSTIAGMYLEPLVREARRLGRALPSARQRYVAFQFYPLREHVTVLVEGTQALFPELSMREALRKLGRGAPRALVQTTLGKIVLGTAEGVLQSLDAIAKTYNTNIKPAHAEIVESAPQAAVVRLERVPFLLDSHHVGVLEGAMSYAGVRGTVKIRMRAADAADFLCEW